MKLKKRINFIFFQPAGVVCVEGVCAGVCVGCMCVCVCVKAGLEFGKVESLAFSLLFAGSREEKRPSLCCQLLCEHHPRV